MPSLFDATFYFAVLGASAAALKHLLKPLETMQELSPIAVSKDKVSNEALWWGCYAFSAMNTGYATIGMWAIYTGSTQAKEGLLLGTGIMFEAFALAWITKGRITGKKDYRKQATKIAILGIVFLLGFASKPSMEL